MQMNLDLEIGALVIVAVVICLQRFGRYVPILRSRIFIQMLMVQMLAIILNIGSRLALYYLGATSYSWVKYIVDCYYMLQ